MVKPLLKYFMLLCIGYSLTACIDFGDEDTRRQRRIEGRLLQSCELPVPIAQMELTLTYTQFLEWNHRKDFTDTDGSFVFAFEDSDWGEGSDSWGPYFAEITDSNGTTIMHGIRPGVENLGNVYVDFPAYKRVFFQLDLSKLLPGDSVEVLANRGKDFYFTTSTAQVADTVTLRLAGRDHWGQIPFDHVVRFRYLIYNADTVRSGDIVIIDVANPCQELVETELVIE